MKLSRARSWAKMAHVINAALVLLLVACGTAEYRTVEVEKKVKVEVKKPFYINQDLVDTPLLPHVMEFAGYCERFKTSATCKKNFEKVLSIRLVPSFSEKFVVGKCFVAPSGERWVEVLDKVIDYDSLTMKTLVMHEVAHCVLGSPFPHYDRKTDIMNPYLLPEQIIQANWPELIKQMFARAGGTLSLTNEPEVTTVTSTVMNESGGFSCEKED